MMEDDDKKKQKSERFIAVLFVVLVCVVAFWEVMSNRSKRPFQPFQLTQADFADFKPESDAWSIQMIPVSPDPIEPNILAFAMTPRGAGQASARLRVIIRLVHGYNLVDCMREKGYQVEALADTRVTAERKSSLPISLPEGKQLQFWRLISPTEDSRICITSMLRDGDFGETNVDTREMAFPRIGIPDPPNWYPQGFSLKGMKEPVKNIRLFLRAKWNSSRKDISVFLGLKQPPWASDDMLTLVAQGPPGSSRSRLDGSEVRQVLAAHTAMYGELHTWRQKHLAKLAEGGDVPP